MEKKLNEFQIFNFNTSNSLNDTIKINSQETGFSTGNIIVQLPVFRKTRKIKYYFNRWLSRTNLPMLQVITNPFIFPLSSLIGINISIIFSLIWSPHRLFILILNDHCHIIIILVLLKILHTISCIMVVANQSIHQ